MIEEAIGKNGNIGIVFDAEVQILFISRLLKGYKPPVFVKTRISFAIILPKKDRGADGEKEKKCQNKSALGKEVTVHKRGCYRMNRCGRNFEIFQTAWHQTPDE